MLARDLGRFAHGGQVDRRVPGEQEPNVVLDGPAGGNGQVTIRDTRKSGLEAGRVGGRQRLQALNARRERLATGRWDPSRVPGPYRRTAPGAGSSRTRRPPVFPRWSRSRPGLPMPIASAVTLPVRTARRRSRRSPPDRPRCGRNSSADDGQ
jgi:hypothetical protein